MLIDFLEKYTIIRTLVSMQIAGLQERFESLQKTAGEAMRKPLCTALEEFAEGNLTLFHQVYVKVKGTDVKGYLDINAEKPLKANESKENASGIVFYEEWGDILSLRPDPRYSVKLGMGKDGISFLYNGKVVSVNNLIDVMRERFELRRGAGTLLRRNI